MPGAFRPYLRLTLNGLLQRREASRELARDNPPRVP